MSNETESMDKVVTALQGASQKLGPAAERVWGLAVEAQRLEAIIDLCCSALLLAVFMTGTFLILKKASKCDKDTESNLVASFFGLLLGLLSCIMLWGVLAGLPEVVGRITYPEYHAAKRLLSSL